MTVREIDPENTHQGWLAIQELRPHLTSQKHFVQQVNELQRPLGYRLLGAFLQDRDDAVAVAGFRINYNLISGKHVYIDDLSTMSEYRGQGYATQILDFVGLEAKAAGCTSIELDSGTQAERAAAHRLYFSQGFSITSFHFRASVS